MSLDLNNYICKVPYEILEIHDNSYFFCCASWLKNHPPKNLKMDEIWNSNVAKEIRESVSDGTFKYCDKSQCPYLDYIHKHNQIDTKGPIVNKSDFPKELYQAKSPYRIDLDFDKSCNYKCPSCRKNVIMADDVEMEKISEQLDSLKTIFGQDVKELYLSASGDPLVSQTYRKFLQDFNPNEFPNLESIHLHTNASMWNKKVWNTMPNVHKYVKSCEISIDAATKDTYENKVRLNGNWDNLILNLKFINTIKRLKLIKTSYVVQQKNYKEMYDFVLLMKSIFGNKVLVLFTKINNWGTFTNEDFYSQKVWDTSHPEHSELLTELKKLKGLTNVYHNMYDLLNEEKSII